MANAVIQTESDAKNEEIMKQMEDKMQILVELLEKAEEDKKLIEIMLEKNKVRFLLKYYLNRSISQK